MFVGITNAAYRTDPRHYLSAASAVCQLLIGLPRHRRSMFGSLDFSVAYPMAWNLILDSFRDLDVPLTVSGTIKKLSFDHSRDMLRHRGHIFGVGLDLF